MHNIWMQYINRLGHAGHIKHGGHVNVGPEHMPLGRTNHLFYLWLLASRGQRDES